MRDYGVSETVNRLLTGKKPTNNPKGKTVYNLAYDKAIENSGGLSGGAYEAPKMKSSWSVLGVSDNAPILSGTPQKKTITSPASVTPQGGGGKVSAGGGGMCTPFHFRFIR